MRKISFPLKLRKKGDEVRNLHEALTYLGLPEVAQSEKENKTYGSTTKKIVAEFQKRAGLTPNGLINEETANRINIGQSQGIRQKGSLFHHFQVPLGMNSRGPEVRELRDALIKLGFLPAEAGQGPAVYNQEISNAVKGFQESVGLPMDGNFFIDTIREFQTALEHAFYSGKKTRVAKINELLYRIGCKPKKDARKNRLFDEEAVRQAQANTGLPATGKISESFVRKLKEEDLKKRLASRTQRGNLHHLIVHVLRIAGLDKENTLDPKELKDRAIGDTSLKAINAIEQKYRLPLSTGPDQLNPDTIDRMIAIVSSNPGRKKTSPSTRSFTITSAALKTAVPPAPIRQVRASMETRSLPAAAGTPVQDEKKKLFRVRGTIRDDLWRGQREGKVQLYYKSIDGSTQLIGERKTLRKGFYDIPYEPPRDSSTGKVKPYMLHLIAFDRDNKPIGDFQISRPSQISWINRTAGLEPYRGPSEYDTKMRAINQVLGTKSIADLDVSRDSREISFLARISGVSRDDIMRLYLSHKTESSVIGFLAEKHLDPDNRIPAQIFYGFIRQNLPPNIPGDLLSCLQQTGAPPDSSQADEETRHLTLEQLVDQTVTGIIFMDREHQARALEAAKIRNLIPISYVRQYETIGKSLDVLRLEYLMDFEVLRTWSLGGLIKISKINTANKNSEIARVFSENRGFTKDFWNQLRKDAGIYGGEENICDFEMTVKLASLLDDHPLTFLKSFVGKDLAIDSVRHTVRTERDYAKLGVDDWIPFINSHLTEFPDIPGPGDKSVRNSQLLWKDFSVLFPTISLIASIKRNKRPSGAKYPDLFRNKNLVGMASDFWDRPEFMDIELQVNLLDTDLTDAINIFENGTDPLKKSRQLLTLIRAFQRIMCITTDVKACAALFANEIFSSSQMVYLGRDECIRILTQEKIDDPAAVYANAEFRYSQVLARIMDFGSELHTANPQAIVRYQPPETSLDGYPDLKTLFGSEDFCDCRHCQSLYGPGAYLADVLRFLKTKKTEDGLRNVSDVLFDRRPDLANIKLNCPNTETPMPYLDIVCEILENAVVHRDDILKNPVTDPDLPEYKFQTSLQPAELGAFPENFNVDAYGYLRTIGYPINNSFDLWQEEARIFLRTLGINRHELMKNFQMTPQPDDPGGRTPSDVSIAGEFFGISSLETSIITTQEADATKQSGYWGLNPSADLPVSRFLDHAKIDFPDLLGLIPEHGFSSDVIPGNGDTELEPFVPVKWIQPDLPGTKIMIIPPVGCCDTDKMMVKRLDDNLTASALTLSDFDKIHRFLRLWRHTGWKMWELDRLILSEKIGSRSGGPATVSLDAGTLVGLMECKQMQDKLGLSYDETLSFIDKISTEYQVDEDDPQKTIPSFYNDLFRDPANPAKLNPDFDLSASNTKELTGIKPSLMAAFSVTDEELDLLLKTVPVKMNPATGMEEPDYSISLRNLTTIFNYVTLAKKMKLKIQNLLTLRDLSGTTDVFSSSKQVLDFLEVSGWIEKSGFSIPEIEYIVRYVPDIDLDQKEQSFGLREETLVQYIEALRDCLNLINPKQEQKIDSIGSLVLQSDDYLRKIDEIVRDPNPESDKISSLFDLTDAVAAITEIIQNYKSDLATLQQKKDQLITETADKITALTPDPGNNLDDIKEILKDPLITGPDKSGKIITRCSVIEGPKIAAIQALLREYESESCSIQKEMEQNIATVSREILTLITDEFMGYIVDTVEDNSISESEKQDRIVTRFSITDNKKIIAVGTIIHEYISERKGQIISDIAATFSLTDKQVKLFLSRIVQPLPEKPDTMMPLIDIINSPELTKKKAGSSEYILDITGETLKNDLKPIADSFRLVDKISLLLKDFSPIGIEDLESLLDNHEKFRILDFSSLPVSVKPANGEYQKLFSGWMALNKWIFFKKLFPTPEKTSFRQIFEHAMSAPPGFDSIAQEISTLTTWNLEDIKKIDEIIRSDGSTLEKTYTDIDTYLRMRKCVSQIKRTGGTAAQALEWADRDAENKQEGIAQQVKKAVQSKYDYSTWLNILTPIQNELRERRRDALMRFLIEYSLRNQEKNFTKNQGPGTVVKSYPNPKYWKTSDILLNYFLIDVEMSACQKTSRIKQAMSSVQMFIQRCFLNLEQPDIKVTLEERADTTSENSWRQWKWMKNYRIWEANRKVFLYPENWIEPELRDDKSPFFRDLENDLAQEEITDENVEAVFTNYLQKVHEVSRLEVIGIYHELDNYDSSETPHYDIDILHVIGRTRTHPSIYYYRQFDLNYATWTAWEKIDVDIVGDHVVAAVYNRHLYLFWLVFTEKPQKVKKIPPAKVTTSDTPADSPEPPKVLEIQLAWTLRKKDGWASRKQSRLKVIHPWQRPWFSYNLKPRHVEPENQLWMDLYISTSLEFNNATFFDPYANSPAKATRTGFSETIRPWHSSSFVFDGDVVEIRLKALNGAYRIMDSTGHLSDDAIQTTSWNYIHDNWGEEGRAICLMSGRHWKGPQLVLPDGMHFHNTHLVNNIWNANNNRLAVLENRSTRVLVNGAKPPFELVISQHALQFDTVRKGVDPFFYQDMSRAFFIRPERTDAQGHVHSIPTYTFSPFYHPYTHLFIRELHRDGPEGLFNRQIQVAPYDYIPKNSFDFEDSYNPGHLGGIIYDQKDSAHDIADFSFSGGYAIYNWEIFFHAPFMIACKLSQNQRFEEAMRWFHFIFDPTCTDLESIPQRYWITKPFFEQNADDYSQQRIDNLLRNIDNNIPQLVAWKNNPFKPHLIARYRPVAYQKAVVMKYIDNLIGWGDQLFLQDTIESINQATTLYILAHELLGPRPIKVPGVKTENFSFRELGEVDLFANKQVIDVLTENFVPISYRTARPSDNTESMPHLNFYFCIPNNENLLEYWDRVEDRLFKIRHCMNIQGIVRQLPLFEPPIDPAILVKAAAAGIDLDSVLSDSGVPQNQYRFRVLLQKALEFCNEVKSFGDKLLSVVEKRDAEGLALLRSINEINLLEVVTEIKKNQIKEAKENKAGLEQAKQLAEQKKEYYTNREFMNDQEKTSARLSLSSIQISKGLEQDEIFASFLHLLPDFTLGASGAGGSPRVSADWGSGNKARSMQSQNSATGHRGSAYSQSSSLMGSLAGYSRRKEDWDFQARLAATEITQIDHQIQTSEIRSMIVEKELENHELQIEQSRSVDEYMHSKYSNHQLYDWMLRQVTTVYFQSYQLAFDMAKRAEKAYQFELGRPENTFIQFGYWDSLKKGLLAGEKLAVDLRRMETAYLDDNKREFEITKHISLAQLNPKSLVDLRETGICMVTLPEELFDMDYPGHYRRRIKSVSITIPCITGPYTGVNCTVSLTGNYTRPKETCTGNYIEDDNSQYVSSRVPIQTIVTSSAQNDAGVFELNFNDERYLPFEGAGVISEWTIDFPNKAYPQFDRNTISDVVFHIRYTSMRGNSSLVEKATANLDKKIYSRAGKLFNLNHEFGSEWNKFISDKEETQSLEFTIKEDHLPFYLPKNVKIESLMLIIENSEERSSADPYKVKISLPLMTSPKEGECTGIFPKILTMQGLSNNFPGTWKIEISKNDNSRIQKDEIREAFLLIRFKK